MLMEDAEDENEDFIPDLDKINNHANNRTNNNLIFVNNNNRGLKNFSLKKFFKSWILIILNRLIKYKISAIFCISKQIKNCYELLGYKNKTILMQIGFDPDKKKKSTTKDPYNLDLGIDLNNLDLNFDLDINFDNIQLD